MGQTRRVGPPFFEGAGAAMIILGLYAAVGGVLSFVGWSGDIPRLTDWDNDGISIQPNATVAVFASGAAVILLAFGRRRIAAALGPLVAVIGSSALFEYLSASISVSTRF